MNSEGTEGVVGEASAYVPYGVPIIICMGMAMAHGSGRTQPTMPAMCNASGDRRGEGWPALGGCGWANRTRDAMPDAGG
jgi:hypothetical protein